MAFGALIGFILYLLLSFYVLVTGSSTLYELVLGKYPPGFPSTGVSGPFFGGPALLIIVGAGMGLGWLVGKLRSAGKQKHSPR